MTTDTTSDVFVSYKAEDRARLKPLVAALEAEGFSVWWDAHIGGGTNWRDDIQEHLNDAKCVIVAWTKRSVGPEGNFVRDEATRAQRAGAYLPIRLDAVEPPLGFGEVQAVSLQGWKGNPADERFRAIVEAVRSRVSGEQQAHRPTHIPQPRLSRRTAVVGGAGAVALAGVGGWLLLKPAPANAKRIAVMPFANLSGDEKQAYFSEGVAEELRAALSRIQLEVIGSASSAAVKDLDSKAAASKLGVANILTGSVRRSPETIRINAQLVSGSDGVERWAQSYDRAPGDAIKIQSDIAANVAQALSVALGQAKRAALSLGGTSDSGAQDLVLQARQLLRDADAPEAYRKCISLADGAIARDANYADAYVAKAFAVGAFASTFAPSPAEMARQIALAEATARKAIQIAPNLGSAHVTLGALEGAQLKFRSSLQYVRHALALAPEDSFVLSMALVGISYLGNGEEALGLADRLTALDPLNAQAYRIKADLLMTQRRYQQSIEAARNALALAPNLRSAHTSIAYNLILLDRLKDATGELRAVPTDDPYRLAGEGMIAARSRDAGAVGEIIARMRPLMGDAASYQYAQIYAQAGDAGRAFISLENALAAKDPGLNQLKVDPFLEPIRADPRYAALIRKLDFP
jgi:serine/threonine-protein kinase